MHCARRAASRAACTAGSKARWTTPTTTSAGPIRPGEIRWRLLGRRLTAAHRRGKSLWCDTVWDGPALGMHLGMSGKIVIASVDGREIEAATTGRAAACTATTAGPRFGLTF